MEQKTEFTIKRSEWGRRQHGETGTAGELVDGSGMLCCLGFFCEQIAGVARTAMKYREMPEDVGVVLLDESTSRALSGLNDRTDTGTLKLTDEEQEKQIQELFAAAGFTARIVD